MFYRLGHSLSVTAVMSWVSVLGRPGGAAFPAEPPTPLLLTAPACVSSAVAPAHPPRICWGRCLPHHCPWMVTGGPSPSSAERSHPRVPARRRQPKTNRNHPNDIFVRNLS
ncbi:hypothetical protein LX32DRAFT_174153 [Colletotrichum zoysiae]|uniref:Secreted protein n=1 Tax=Colletotrichum zoysiae TaxID=1216348 RepID=A0AAD9H695_9PEZI|nr:hypothetical protein LX32DRAFT_174153 [Colletotrichum zoysiae]